MNDMNNAKYLKYRSKFFIAEFLGTALLLLGGLSIVIFMFGTGSPMSEIIPAVKVRQIITGFLFGSIGASIALSPIGKVSGAHINPAVTMVFWLFRKIEGRLTITYILAQLTGAVVGCLPLLLWGQMGKSIEFGVTVPGAGYSLYYGITWRSYHHIYNGLTSCNIHWIQANTKIYSVYVSIPVCHHGAFGSGNFRYKYKSCKEFWSCSHFRTVGWMVDLFDWSNNRCITREYRV